MAVISLIDEDRQWFKAKFGVAPSETVRATSFCTHTIRSAAMFVVQDASSDPRFSDNPFVVGDPSIRFYAGISLTSKSGHRIGTLCVMGSDRRAPPNQAERRTLIALANRAIAALDARRKRLSSAA